MELDTIVCADALEFMQTLPDESVDCVVTDPPYGTIAQKWDSIVPFEPLWEQFKSVIKPGGVVVIFGSQPFTALMITANLDWFRYEWIWEKSQGTGYLNAGRNPMKSHENIMVFYSQLKTYNPQFEKGKAYSATRGAVGGFVRDKSVGGYITKNNGFRFPKTILRYTNDTGLHPTQKPLALIEYLIKTYTQPGDIVLDPFCGSGTTGLAALKTGRHYILGDTSQEYVGIARQRIQNANPYVSSETADGVTQLSLFEER